MQFKDANGSVVFGESMPHRFSEEKGGEHEWICGEADIVDYRLTRDT